MTDVQKPGPRSNSSAHSAKLPYPQARKVDAVSAYSGVEFPDPYRWLEEETEEVRQWQRAQAQFADEYVERWPFLDQLRDRVSYFMGNTGGSVPSKCCYSIDKWFITPSNAPCSIAIIDSLSEENQRNERIIFTADFSDLGDNPLIGWLSASPDGKYLAFGVSANGSEQNVIRLLDLDTALLVSAPSEYRLQDSWMGGVHWLPDSSGFYFYGLLAGADDITKQQFFLHKLGPQAETIPQDVPPLADSFSDAELAAASGWALISFSPNGRWAVVTQGLVTPRPTAFKDLHDPESAWEPFVNAVTDSVKGYPIGDQYVAITTHGAPRGRVVAIPFDSKTPNDPASWIELVPESNRVIRNMTPIADKIYLSEFKDTYGRVRIIEPDGTLCGEVKLPGNGAVATVPLTAGDLTLLSCLYRGDPNRFIYSYSSLNRGAGLCAHEPGRNETIVLSEPKVVLADTVVEDLWAVSKDGTRVPYHLVYHQDIDRSRLQPALVLGYGGFAFPYLPQFQEQFASFVEAGGILVHTHIRGGGELGQDWWQQGRMLNKQNGYDDLYAIAESLIEKGYCAPDLLAVWGGSNGGLMAGVAATQRPDLWRVAVSSVPILDLIGWLRYPYGKLTVNAEYADIENPDEIDRLATFSPYELLKDDRQYPAMYMMGGGTDHRAAPWHARKFGARLQTVTATTNPALARIWENAGHGQATDGDVVVEQYTYRMGFVMQQLGMSLE